MTYEKAIEELEWIYQNGFENDIKIIGTDRILDAIRMGIEALDKQIPKKLKHEQYWYTCPNCEEIVIRFDNEPKDENYRYCSWCGQRLE